jgi:hypothetical protein
MPAFTRRLFMAGGHVRPSLRRWCAVVGAAVLVASALALSGAGPAAAAIAVVPVGGGGGGDGGGDGGGGNPCADVTGSFTNPPPSPMHLSASYTVSWTLQRPAGCASNISSMLIGPGSPGTVHVSAGGTDYVSLPATVQGPATYSIAAFWPGGSVTVASVTVAVAQGPWVNIEHETNSTACLGLIDTVAGAPLDVENCDGSTRQAFRFWPVAGIDNGFIVTTSQGLCLANAPDTLVSQFPCPTTALDPAFVWKFGALFDSFPGVDFMFDYEESQCMTSVNNLPWATLVGAVNAQFYGLGSYTVGLQLQECNPFFTAAAEFWVQVPRT